MDAMLVCPKCGCWEFKAETWDRCRRLICADCLGRFTLRELVQENGPKDPQREDAD